MEELALLRQAIDLTGVGFVLTDPALEDHPIVFANRSFLALTGYPREAVVGRNCRFLQGPDTDPKAVEELRRAVRSQRATTVELRNYRRDGSAFWNEVHIAPVRDERGDVVRFVGVLVDVSHRREQRRARAAAEIAERHSTFLAGASPLLDASLDPRSTLDSLTHLSVPYLGDTCVVYEIRFDEVRRLAASDGTGVGERRPVRSDDPLVRAIQSGRAEIVPGLGMVVPLTARGTTIGAVTFGPERGYNSDELVLAEDLAHRAALALDNARLYENLSSVAQLLQQGLLPPKLPALAGMDFSARFRPVGDGSLIGGDFYDVLVRDGGVDLVIGDVTGKGARAAALTAQVRHTVRTAARYEASPSAVLDVVNRTLIAERTDSGRYCTIAFCRLGLDGRATICCAGHPMPMVVRCDGDVELVGRPGSVLGWVPDPKLLDVEFSLGEGESLVLYTDGVTEARTDGDAFGPEGLEALLRAAAGEDAAGIAARVDRAAARAGQRRDDVAVLVVRREGTCAG